MSLTLAEVEEALEHLRAVPAEERGAAWSSYLDALLDQRGALIKADERLTEIKAERASVGR